MSDLIRREDVIKCLQENGWLDDTNIDELIETIPIAYDIGKVVEELGQKKEEVQRMRNTCVALSDLEVCDIENVTYERAIEIVKQGGVSDDVCECRLFKGHKFLHETSCGNVFDMENVFAKMQ